MSYEDGTFYDPDPNKVLWPHGQQPGNTHAWIVHLEHNGYIPWSLSTTPPSLAGSSVLPGKIGDFLSSNPTAQTLNPAEYGFTCTLVNNKRVIIEVTVSEFRPKIGLKKVTMKSEVIARNIM